MSIGLGLALLLGISQWLGAFAGLSMRLTDSLYTQDTPSDEIVIVAIDDQSTLAPPFGYGRFSQWSRDQYAEVLDALILEHPKVIAFDLIFNHPTDTVKFSKLREFFLKTSKEGSPIARAQHYEAFIEAYSQPSKAQEDAAFAEKIREAGNVILAFAADEKMSVFPLRTFSEHAEIGSVVAYPDEDGILRKLPLSLTVKDTAYPSLALAVAEKFAERKFEVPVDNSGMHINYFADPFGYTIVSFVDVIRGKFEPGLFRDKIVLIGITSFKEIQDKALTPRSNKVPMPGVEVHANAIQTILDEKFLQPQSRTGQLLTTAGLALVLTTVFSVATITWATLLLGVALLGYWLLAHAFYRQGLILNMVYPFLAIVLAYIAAWVYRYCVADRKKREITSAFSHYVSRELVAQIAANPEMVKLGGEKRIVTVFFSDIKDSTGHSEKTDSVSWVAQINEYFTAMEWVIKRYGGTLDKYEGDAIMGFFNAPVAQPDHVVRAYGAALEMQAMLQRLNEKWQREGRPELEVRIGINTGEVIVGNFGSRDRFDYTVMGDTVNTASRLESAANKTYGTQIMVAGAVDAQCLIRTLDTVMLPGKKEPVEIGELMGRASEASAQMQQCAHDYAEGLRAYRRKDFVTAQTYFTKHPEDTPSHIMAERCRTLESGGTVRGLDAQMVFHIRNK